MASSGIPRKAASTKANAPTPQIPRGVRTASIQWVHLANKCFTCLPGKSLFYGKVTGTPRALGRDTCTPPAMFPGSETNQKSNAHKPMQFRCRHAAFDKAELAVLPNLMGGVEQPGHGGAIQRGGQADAPDSRRGKFPNGERLPRDPHHEVHRA